MGRLAWRLPCHKAAQLLEMGYKIDSELLVTEEPTKQTKSQAQDS